MTGFPWSQGDALLADDLNAAIAGATVPVGGSIQAALDALPATGGEVRLSPNTTYAITTAIVSAIPNVRLSAPGWGTVIQRGPALAGTMLQLSGVGCLIENMTFDGNGTVNTSGNAEVQISGANSRITNVQVINSSGTINIAVSGIGGRVDHCTIAGRGVSLGTERGSGIWAANNVPVTIDHNRITGTGLDGISVSGPGVIIANNYVATRHWTTGGGQIVVYPTTTDGAGTIVSNNFVGQGGSTATGGIEVYGNNVTITGNTIVNQYSAAIGVGNVGTSKGIVIAGNNILNVGLDGSGNQDGISIGTGVTDFVISGNRVGDDQTPTKMRWAVGISGIGAVNRYVISGNLFGPTAHSSIIADGGAGLVKVISDNAGLDTSVQATYNTGTLSIPPSNPFYLNTTGTLAPITAIGAGNAAAGAIRTALPNAAFVFQAGNNIQNTITTTANVPFTMTMDGFGKWWLR